MSALPLRPRILIAVWMLLTLASGVLLARHELSLLREAFETDARIMHRLISQRMLQHDAVLSTLALLQPAGREDSPEQRLPAVYPQILAVLRLEAESTADTAALASAHQRSEKNQRAELGPADMKAGRYWVVRWARPHSYALWVDMKATVPWTEWPVDPATSPVRVQLQWQQEGFTLQPGHGAEGSWQLGFRKHVAAESQPFDVVVDRHVGWAELPWWSMLACSALVAIALGAWAHLMTQRVARRRAEELLRLGQVSRLNALGELAAGMAHELNQPLTALLANTQAAHRLLASDPPDLTLAQQAMTQSVKQARRASDVVHRLRRLVERPELSAQVKPVDADKILRDVLELLEPERLRRQIRLQVHGATHHTLALAEPVALEQIMHNLLMNAFQALEQVPAPDRQLDIALAVPRSNMITITFADSGPGIADEILPRLFEPFFTTRQDGLGLGLSLCESLAQAMGGQLVAANGPAGGAVFTLTLPTATE